MLVRVVLLGIMDYKEVYEMQKKLLKMRQQGTIEDTLILVEHKPVITLGKRGGESNILASKQFLEERGINVYPVDRGGNVTYHGPGQIVGYPIIDVKNYGKDIRKFVHNIEEIFIQLLRDEYSIIAGRNPVNTGVWVEDEKITAIGFAVKRWVTMHGFAFNVNTNMEHFRLIYPCGIKDKGVTSLERLTGNTLEIDELINQIKKYFSKIFDVQIQEMSKEILLQLLEGDAVEQTKT